VLQNATVNPDNADFSMFGYSGMWNMTPTGEIEVYASKPHFLDADPALVSAIGAGIAPVRNLHDTWLDVEPISGITLRASKRLMGSVRLTPVNATLPFGPPYAIWGANLPSQGPGLYMPLYWVDESIQATASQTSLFSTSIYGAQQASTGVAIAGEVLGVVFAVAAVVLLIMASRASSAVVPTMTTTTVYAIGANSNGNKSTS